MIWTPCGRISSGFSELTGLKQATSNPCNVEAQRSPTCQTLRLLSLRESLVTTAGNYRFCLIKRCVQTLEPPPLLR